MASLGPMELTIILVIVLVVFGAGKISEVGGALGRGIREFRKASDGDFDEATKATTDTAQATADAE